MYEDYTGLAFEGGTMRLRFGTGDWWDVVTLWRADVLQLSEREGDAWPSDSWVRVNAVPP